MTLDQFDGLPDAERKRWLALDAIESEPICPDHGGPMDECEDQGKRWYPQRRLCFATAERMAAERTYDRLHEEQPFHDGKFRHWSKRADKAHPYHYRDGVTIYVADHDVNPDDHFLTANGGALGGNPS